MFHSRKVLLISLVVTWFFASHTTAQADPIIFIDQHNLASAAGTNGGPGALFGQSFTPGQTGLDAIEVLMGGQNVTVTVDILSVVAGFDGLQGTVIATSLPVFVNTQGAHQMIHFDFATTVALNPGQTYVLRLFSPGDIGVSWSNDIYPFGQFLHAGFAIGEFTTSRDLIFITGLHTGTPNEIPEPATMLLLGASLAGLASRMHKRKTI
jgi:PEP-CTERM motif-containing protein